MADGQTHPWIGTVFANNPMSNIKNENYEYEHGSNQ
jgi:hypothetical protein